MPTLSVQDALFPGCLGSIKLATIERIELSAIADDHIRRSRISGPWIVDNYASDHAGDGVPSHMAFSLDTADSVRIIEINGRKGISAAAVGQIQAVNAAICSGCRRGGCATTSDCHGRLYIIHSGISYIDGYNCLRRGHNCRRSSSSACTCDLNGRGSVVAARVCDRDIGDRSSSAYLGRGGRAASITHNGDGHVGIGQRA